MPQTPKKHTTLTPKSPKPTISTCKLRSLKYLATSDRKAYDFHLGLGLAMSGLGLIIFHGGSPRGSFIFQGFINLPYIGGLKCLKPSFFMGFFGVQGVIFIDIPPFKPGIISTMLDQANGKKTPVDPTEKAAPQKSCGPVPLLATWNNKKNGLIMEVKRLSRIGSLDPSKLGYCFRTPLTLAILEGSLGKNILKKQHNSRQLRDQQEQTTRKLNPWKSNLSPPLNLVRDCFTSFTILLRKGL